MDIFVSSIFILLPHIAAFQFKYLERDMHPQGCCEFSAPENHRIKSYFNLSELPYCIFTLSAPLNLRKSKFDFPFFPLFSC